MPTWPSPSSERLGTPKIPAIRFTRGTYFGASRFTYATACQVARPPLTDRTRSPRPQRAFTSRLPAVWSPSLPLGITTTWTGLLLLAGLAPARMAASLAAPDPILRSGLSGEPTISGRSTASAAAGYQTVIRSWSRCSASRRLAVFSEVTRCISPTSSAHTCAAERRPVEVFDLGELLHAVFLGRAGCHHLGPTARARSWRTQCNPHGSQDGVRVRRMREGNAASSARRGRAPGRFGCRQVGCDRISLRASREIENRTQQTGKPGNGG